ncbi:MULTISPECIES: methylated-DNA--[protein]-cysteine S-methyltransferase [unclassified Nitratiruptor]|uniref:methylated-DNA--[protein]-cysteine S-methyltransferase n=1 Tax=unclassified Nitratiruptor TaxID=2624044 RepID=UPI0019151077|nr:MULTISPECIES: methylated-DNA--[protein]-cysteine S-methyltransferase [unclassified Nitratiruptor]
MELYSGYYVSPIGIIEIVTNEQNLIHIHFVYEQNEEKINELILESKEWLRNYFSKKIVSFPVPLVKAKRDFSQRVREIVQKIPFGTCLTYQEVAMRSGNEKAAQAVGQIMKHNPYAIIVPCHRVISKQGIGGYNGGIEIKKKLLEFEGCGLINL